MKSRLLLLVFLLPLFFIGIHKNHDWGDDYAQYILQAKSIAKGGDQINHQLVFADNELPYAVKAYPVGFPLVLAPVFALYGLSIPPYLFLNTAFLILTCLLFFEYLKKYFDVKISFLISILLGYNVIFLVLKMEILSEFLFNLILMAIFLLSTKTNKRSLIFIGILTGFLASVRISGLVILPALFLWQMMSVRDISFLKKLKNYGVLFSLTIAMFCLLNVLFFEVGIRNFFDFYWVQTKANPIIVSNAFKRFFYFSCSFIYPESPSPLKVAVILLIICGLVPRLKRPGLMEWFFLCYLILFLLFPDKRPGTRLIFIVTPVLLVWLVSGIEFFFSDSQIKKYTLYLMLCVTIASTIVSVRMCLEKEQLYKSYNDGPYSKSAQATFNYIKTNIPEKEIILFSRARAINLYTDRKSTFLVQHKKPEENMAILRKLKCNYLLYAAENCEAFNESVQDFMMSESLNYDTVFVESPYILFKLKGVSNP